MQTREFIANKPVVGVMFNFSGRRSLLQTDTWFHQGNEKHWK